MRHLAGRAVASTGLFLLVAGCGSTPTASRTAGSASPTATTSAAPAATGSAAASASATPGATPIANPPTTAAAIRALLATIYAQLHPASSGGRDCVTGTTSPVWSACPLTARLVAALNATLAHQGPGPGFDPLCGCQALDPRAMVTYTVGTPTGGGAIHVSGFGAPLVTYVVIPLAGRLLVDDIIYCSPPPPQSIYRSQTASAC